MAKMAINFLGTTLGMLFCLLTNIAIIGAAIWLAKNDIGGRYAPILLFVAWLTFNFAIGVANSIRNEAECSKKS
ncbi:MAG: hypothetical protein AAGH53_02055 [Pseudomonadota bacterium]